MEPPITINGGDSVKRDVAEANYFTNDIEENEYQDVRDKLESIVIDKSMLKGRMFN